MRKKRDGWIYVLDSNIEAHQNDDCRIFKIGRATSLSSRVKQLGTAYAFKPTINYAFYVEDYLSTEAELHELFAGQRLNGEWFRLDYADLGFISDYAGNSGYFENESGQLLPDPLMPHLEAQRIADCIAELEKDYRLATKVKYFPLGACLDLPVCLLETEEILSDEDEWVRQHEDAENRRIEEYEYA